MTRHFAVTTTATFAFLALASTATEARAINCPTLPPRIVVIQGVSPEIDLDAHFDALRTLHDELAVPNTTVLLGHDVVLDFAFADDDMFPVHMAACTKLMSAPDPKAPVVDVAGAAPQQSARTPQSLGPQVLFGPHRSKDIRTLLNLECRERAGGHNRISGFRLFGPKFSDQGTDEFGIRVFGCRDVEISNMELAGWGGAAIRIEDDVKNPRLDSASDVLVFDNHIHHNQHSSSGFEWDWEIDWGVPLADYEGHAAGYGVDVHHGGFAQIFRNVFDFNRHAIAAAGDMRGYDAFENLVLKGGGRHYDSFITGTIHTHQFDIHGTGDNGFGGRAGDRSLFAHNTFQYRKDNAIGIRGRPTDQIIIRDNIFPHEGLEDDWGDDAIMVDDRDNLDVIQLGPNNRIERDTYGKYGVCDFDGDEVDDLFLATGQTWWFSSMGEFHWTYLATRIEELDDVALGYFDNDDRCDVLTEVNGELFIASAGKAWWQSLGNFGAPLSQLHFGRFDPDDRDHRAGATKRTTHAFRRKPDGEWLVTPLNGGPAWHHANHSSFSMDDLLFGDFTGDGVTDILAVEGDEWSISDAAHGSWQTINSSLDDDVTHVYVADIDHNNVDDVLRFAIEDGEDDNGNDIDRVTWWVSFDGRSYWQELVSYELPAVHPYGGPAAYPRAYAGRFGSVRGGGTLMIDRFRVGNFFSELVTASGADPQWTALFEY